MSSSQSATLRRNTRATIKRHMESVDTPSGMPIPQNQRREKFVYVHYPTGWEFVDALEEADGKPWGFLPTLKMVIARPGANGVPDSGDMSRPIQSHLRAGATYIDPKDPRLSEEFRHYVSYVETPDGGRHYVEIGEEPIALPSGQILQDREGVIPKYRAFLAAIRDSGIIDPMIPEVYQGLVERDERRRQMLGGRIGQNPHLQARYDHHTRRLEMMAEAWEAYQSSSSSEGTPPPAPTARVRRRLDSETPGVIP